MIRFAGVLVGAVLAPVGALAAQPVTEEVSDWAGFYLGGHFGGGWGNSDWFDLGVGNIGSHQASGILGGGQAGYNFQNGPWMWGPQASISGADLGGSHNDAVFGSGPIPQPDRGTIDVLGTLTGRLGYASGPFLLYAQGGAAWAHTRYTLIGFFAPGQEFAVSDETKWGWTAGAGIEYGFAAGWSGFLEYDYLGFGSDVASLKCTAAAAGCGPGGSNAIGISIRENYHLVKSGVNFRF
jgi:outer membrane immunogenic protein